MKHPASNPAWIPWSAALCLIAAGLARPLQAAGHSAGTAPEAWSSLPFVPGPAASAPEAWHTPGGVTETRLRAALPGRTFIRLPSGELPRIAALQSPQGRFLSGPALAASLSRASAPAGDSLARAVPCPQPDSLLRRRCLDSLTRASGPRALRELAAARDSAPGGGPRSGGGADPEARKARASLAEADGEAAADAEDIQAQRNRGYFSQFFVDLGRGGDWDWDLDEWAVVIYVVVGVVVVGAFVLWGAKALYDLAVNRDDSPVFKEAALQFSYTGRTLRYGDGATLFRDAWLMGGRFAFGVEKPVVSFGLALEGGAIDLSVRAPDTDREIVDVQGGYLVGGPLVRFGRYRPLAFTLEFLNGTSSHASIGWISKSRMTLASRTRAGLTYGAHLGAVFYDLRFSDGLVYRRGDFNRDLSVLFGLDAGWSF